jgi:hypothetical protein
LAATRQFAERFVSAVQLLGQCEKGVVPVAGIYELEQIARESRKHFEIVVRMLTTAVRGSQPDKDPWDGLRCQAALDVLGRLLSEDTSRRTPIDLSDSDLRGANLREWKKVTATVVVSGANLRGVRVPKTLIPKVVSKRAPKFNQGTSPAAFRDRLIEIGGTQDPESPPSRSRDPSPTEDQGKCVLQVVLPCLHAQRPHDPTSLQRTEKV